ncbi:MAG: dihydrolipoamide succinyltransferase, partial [Hyphomicrobiales bacterium]|nr:dihydrolipoamide succinyltransferase [Hyphomicrobiales bacterium]
MTDIIVPTLGESVSEATVAKWLKKKGEVVSADEPIVELETDKVTLEVNAPASGVIEDVAAADGATVTPGALLGRIAAGAGAKPGTVAAKSAPAQAQVLSAAASPAGTAMPPAPAAARLA